MLWYPDASIDIYVTKCEGLDDVSAKADAALLNAANVAVKHKEVRICGFDLFLFARWMRTML